MRFYILGIGPIGSLLAYHLRVALPPAHSITLIHKSIKQARLAVSSGGKIFVENRGVVQSCNGFDREVFEPRDHTGTGVAFDSTLSEDEIISHPPHLQAQRTRTDVIETLFVTTKAQNTTNSILRLRPRLTPRSTIVLLQNGMGIYEDLVQRVFRNPESRPHFILASNTHGAWLKSPTHVVHAGIGRVDFGITPDSRGKDFEASLSDNSKPPHERALSLDDITYPSDVSYSQYSSLRETVSVLNSLDAFGSEWNPIADVQLAMRKKLVVNAVVNPLTAILGCRNGALFQDDASNRMLRDVCNEAAAAFHAQFQANAEAYLQSLPSDAEGTQVPLGRVPRELEADALVEEVKRVAELTKGNLSSTLLDIRKGRETEISFLNGYLVRLGKEYGISMPVNSFLVDLVNMRSRTPVDSW